MIQVSTYISISRRFDTSGPLAVRSIDVLGVFGGPATTEGCYIVHPHSLKCVLIRQILVVLYVRTGS